jgi:hypothetical protein
LRFLRLTPYVAPAKAVTSVNGHTPDSNGDVSLNEYPVLYTEQSLTLTQKAKARENIGAVAVSDAVLCKEQTLADAEKERARANIGAASQLKMDWVAGKFIDNALVLLDKKLGNGLLYVDSGKLKLTLQDGQEKTVTFLTNEDGVGGTVLYTAQALTDAQKLQARTNIGAAEKMQVERNTARLLEGSLALTDQKNDDAQVLYAEAGKLYMKNQAVPGQRVRFLTNEDEQRIVDSVLAALPIYGGEVETV